MRVDVGDPDIGRLVSNAFEAWIDGAKSECCVMADDELNCAELVVLDEFGHLILDESLPRGHETRMVWGVIEIRDRNPHDAAILRQYLCGVR